MFQRSFNKVKYYLRKIGYKASKGGSPSDSLKRIGNNISSHNLVLGSPVSVGNNCSLYNVVIGDYTYLSNNVSSMNTVIGKYCSIGQGVCISIGTHPSHTFVSSSPVFFSPYKQCGVTFSDRSHFDELGNSLIGNDVWIGANAIILNNVNLGDGAIIGAGSVVTKDVPPYAIAVGVPAKILKYRFLKEEIDFLLDFKWWNRDTEWVRENFKDFHDIKVFIKKYENG